MIRCYLVTRGLSSSTIFLRMSRRRRSSPMWISGNRARIPEIPTNSVSLTLLLTLTLTDILSLVTTISVSHTTLVTLTLTLIFTSCHQSLVATNLVSHTIILLTLTHIFCQNFTLLTLTFTHSHTHILSPVISHQSSVQSLLPYSNHLMTHHIFHPIDHRGDWSHPFCRPHLVQCMVSGTQPASLIVSLYFQAEILCV